MLETDVMVEAKKPVHSRTVVGRNAIVQMIAVVFSRAVGLVFNMLIARQLGEEALGGFRFSLTYVTYFQVFAALGLTLLTVRELSAKPEKATSIFSDAVLLRTGAAILSWFIIATSLPLLSYSATVNLLILTLSSTVLTYGLADAAMAAFTAFQRMELNLYTTVLGALGYFLFGMIGFFAGLGVLGIAIAVVLSNLLTSILGLYLVHRCLFPVKISMDWTRLRRWTRLMVPFFLLSITANLSERADMFLLSRLTTFQVIGWYSAAYLLLDVAKLLPTSFVTALFPALTSRWATSADQFRSAINTALRGVLLITGVFPVVLIPISDRVIEALYGPAFSPSASVLRVLMICPVFFGINFAMGSAILAVGAQGPLVLVTALMLASNVVLNLWLIPGLGAMGASVAKLVSFGIGTLLHLILLRNRKVQVNLVDAVLRIMLCLLTTVGMMLVLAPSIGLVAVPAGLAAYGLLLYLSGALKKTDLTLARQLLRSFVGLQGNR